MAPHAVRLPEDANIRRCLVPPVFPVEILPVYKLVCKASQVYETPAGVEEEQV